MFNKRLTAILLVAALGFGAMFVGACTTEPEPGQTSLDIRGSDTLINLGAAWVEAFEKENPDFSLAVQGGGSGTGAKQLINLNADIAQMSRAMKDSEKEQAQDAGFEAVEHIVAYDGVAMIIHKDNPINELSVVELARIFRSEATNWQEFGGNDGGIVALSRDTASGTHVFVKEHVVWERGDKEDLEYGPEVQFLTSNQAIHDEVAQNPLAIGYVGLGYLTDDVKPLAVKADDASPAVLPSVATVKDKTYDISRPLFNYTRGEPEGLVKTYLDFVMGDDGQMIVEDLGFVPIK